MSATAVTTSVYEPLPKVKGIIRHTASPATKNIGGREYPITGYVENGGVCVPLMAMPMMSDERWQDLTRQRATEHLRKAGREPTDELIAKYHAYVRWSCTPEGEADTTPFYEALAKL